MDLRNTVVRAGQKLKGENLTVETWGNISIRDDDGLVYITPSGMDYDSSTVDDIVVMSIKKDIISGKRRPSIETDLHLEIYKNHPEIRAVVHTHPIFSTVFSCMGENIPLFTDEAAQALGDEVKTAPYALPGSIELAKNCVAALGDKSKACLLQSHGAVCIGKDLNEAFKVAKVLEMTAEILYRIRAVGENYIPISQQNIEAMQILTKTKYGQSPSNT